MSGFWSFILAIAEQERDQGVLADFRPHVRRGLFVRHPRAELGDDLLRSLPSMLTHKKDLQRRWIPATGIKSGPRLLDSIRTRTGHRLSQPCVHRGEFICAASQLCSSAPIAAG